METFTKLYDKEIELLEDCSGKVLKVYNHIKKVYSYQKKASFDHQSRIIEDTELSKSTVIRAIQRLEEVGLIKDHKRGRYNYYVLPIFDECEGRVTEDFEQKARINKSVNVTAVEKEIVEEKEVKDMGYINEAVVENKTLQAPIEETIEYDSDRISEKVFDFLDEFEVSGNKNEKYGYKCVKYRDMLNSNYSLIKDTAINDITVLLKSEGITDESEVNFVIDVIKNKPSRNININIS